MNFREPRRGTGGSVVINKPRIPHPAHAGPCAGAPFAVESRDDTVQHGLPLHEAPMTSRSAVPALLATAGLAITCPAAPPGYAKVWEDNFDQPSLNTNNWTIGLRDPATGDLVPGAQGDFLLNSGYEGYITPEDVVVANGILSLLNQKRTVQGQSPGGQYDYSSGWVMSMHKVHTNTGYLEWRAKFPTGDKVWPALWLIAEDLVWGPEWDCFEYFGYRQDAGYDVMGTHLLYDEYPDQKWSTFWVHDFDLTYDAGAWHVYGFEWTETYAKWFVDGVEVRHLDNTFGASWPDEEMYIVMNNGVKASSPDTNTTWPNALEIDYVSLYEKCATDLGLTLTNPSFEADGPGKQPGTVPAGWSTDAPAGEGFEPAGATDGINAALLDQVSNNPGENTNKGFGLHQTTSHHLSRREVITLAFDAVRTWTTTGDWGRVRAILYYDDGGVRRQLADLVVDLPDGTPRPGLSMTHVVTDPQADGKALGVEFRSESWGETWVTVDHVRLSGASCPPTIHVSDAWFDGGDFKVEATNLVPGAIYHLRRGLDLSLPSPFTTTVDTRSAASPTETFIDPGAEAHADRAFYTVTE